MLILRFYKLKKPYKVLVVQALVLQWLFRIMLWVLPFSFIKRRFIKGEVSPELRSKLPIKSVMWGVMVTSRYIISSTCLTRALTGHMLGRWYHYPTSVRIGVGKYEGEFEAHAWLEYKGDVVLGLAQKKYVELVELK
ncbi:MAG: lasso peptide biosynthesis B2 protein [Euryarchaeota archaeon]|nr:lasso peptide biosynthesis B2 protein [Euryarchaeota archaeon]MBU4548235.1 lasso peptide biosynthesis B2 protein [Euryarchaeota archaeon]MBU4608572.1 lasso peptide biosynthesis B2 protein [Euryarchaeota archaeon]MBV1755377.1 lasso peptide biosynthesis B2 protein [Methanobacterium sp.]MBV1767743.1 lasso peptide biosynthesis B2 protein [Methanobacterium sp.]